MSYCCPACALSEHKQSGRTVQIVSLTDFNTGRDLDPNAAFLVRGSDVSSCAHLGSTVVMDKQPAEPLYDRCAPSLLAFSTQSAAAEFSRIHGGRVLPFADVRGQYR